MRKMKAHKNFTVLVDGTGPAEETDILVPKYCATRASNESGASRYSKNL